MTPEEEKHRLAWQCRRGMLELDELLLLFLEREYDGLPADLKSAFRRLLTERDPDLFQWLFERPDSAPDHYAGLLKRLRSPASP